MQLPLRALQPPPYVLRTRLLLPRAGGQLRKMEPIHATLQCNVCHTGFTLSQALRPEIDPPSSKRRRLEVGTQAVKQQANAKDLGQDAPLHPWLIIGWGA